MVDLKYKMGYLCRLIENMRDLIISSRLFLCNTKRTWMLLPGSFFFSSCEQKKPRCRPEKFAIRHNLGAIEFMRPAD